MNNMKKFERQAAIEKIVKGHSFILIPDISKKLAVSESTIRRDINEMEQKQLLFRSQGAVIWNDRGNQYMENVYYRQIQNVDAKKLIAAKTASMIEPQDTLFIGTGTTTYELAKSIPGDMPLTVVTNDLHIALLLENNYNATIMMLGGFIKRGTHTVVGALAERSLEGIFFNKCFISPGGVTKEDGFTFYNVQALEVRRKALKNAEQKIMLVDSLKFGKRGFISGFAIEQCDILITDQVDAEWKQFLSAKIKLICCA
jgi:DeoR/GlpR family transcriptional regulator of sugar metabolism